MGASLVYLKEPNKEIEFEDGSNEFLKYAAGNMQGWRLNMVSKLWLSISLLQEDAHVANSKFLGDENKALFGVFDGHGGREVAVFCNKHYETILDETRDTIKSSDEKEWLRQSFLKVDDKLRLPGGQNEIGDLRREKPPKKAAFLNMLGEAGGEKKDPSQQTNEEMMLDSIGCTSNVIYIDKS